MAKVFGRDLNSMMTFIEGLPDELKGDVADLIDDATIRGEELMGAFISTRGTRTSAGPGREETYNMRDKVSHTQATEIDGKIVGTFGWSAQDAEDYFFYQENGFRHWISGENIPPMHALLDSFIRASEEWKENMDNLT